MLLSDNFVKNYYIKMDRNIVDNIENPPRVTWQITMLPYQYYFLKVIRQLLCHLYQWCGL